MFWSAYLGYYLACISFLAPIKMDMTFILSLFKQLSNEVVLIN
jgi:hypothetical protein